MRVGVLGAGVVGVATAFELWRDGHEVILVDRHEAPACETSFANAGMIAPGHAYAWSSPKAVRTLLRALWRDDLALRFRFQADPRFWRWCWRFYRQCTDERAAANTRRKVALCLYSQQRLHEVVAATGVAYAARPGGALYIYRSPGLLAGAAATARILRDEGVEIRTLGPDEVVALDPAYAAVRGSFAGALFAPGDESGDARLFTLGLAQWLERQGVALRLGTTITGFDTGQGRIAAVQTTRGPLAADAFVLALGPYAGPVGRLAGLDLPVYPIKGYSVTIPITPASRPPSLSGVDEENLFAFANFGDRLRMTAIAEFAGYDASHRPEDFAPMLKAARSLFPQGGDYGAPSYWAGLRPMTPDNLPIFGRGRLENLWVNAGHGHMGWTWACGAARITADLIAGSRPEHDVSTMLLR